MKQTKEQVLENLNNISYNVMFTKEELINIVESIEESNHTTIPFDSYINEITEHVVSTLQDMSTDELISDFEVELNNKEVYVESIEINERNVTKKIKTELTEYFKRIVKYVN